MAAKGLSLRQLARQAQVSPAYLSRLFSEERGAPADKVIARFEQVLDIQPRGTLFDAAGRHDTVASKVLKKPNARVLMRTLAPLNDKELAQVLHVAEQLAAKHKHPKD